VRTWIWSHALYDRAQNESRQHALIDNDLRFTNLFIHISFLSFFFFVRFSMLCAMRNK